MTFYLKYRKFSSRDTRNLMALHFHSYNLYNFHMLRVGVGNEIQLFDMLDFEGTETPMKLQYKFPVTHFIEFLPYVGFHSENSPN